MDREKKKRLFLSLQNLQKRLGSSRLSLPSRTADNRPVNQEVEAAVILQWKSRSAWEGHATRQGSAPQEAWALSSRLPGKSGGITGSSHLRPTSLGGRLWREALRNPPWSQAGSTHLRSGRPVCPLGQPREAEGIKTRPFAELLWRITTPVIHTPMLILKFDYITLKMSQLPPLDMASIRVWLHFQPVTESTARLLSLFLK